MQCFLVEGTDSSSRQNEVLGWFGVSLRLYVEISLSDLVCQEFAEITVQVSFHLISNAASKPTRYGPTATDRFSLAEGLMSQSIHPDVRSDMVVSTEADMKPDGPGSFYVDVFQ